MSSTNTSTANGSSETEREARSRVGRFLGLEGGSEDIEDWLNKVDFCKRAFPTAIGDEATFIGSLLDGEPWQAFTHLDDGVKTNATRLRQWLKDTYGMRPDDAFRRLRSRAMGPDETVQRYVTDFRRLVARTQAVDLEHWKALMFIDGLPDYLRQGLATKGGAKSVDAAMTILKDLEIAKNVGRVGVGARAGSVASRLGPPVSSHFVTQPSMSMSQDSGAVGGARTRVECYLCRGPHLRKDCPQKENPKFLKCFRCSRKGHFAKNCPEDNPNSGSCQPFQQGSSGVGERNQEAASSGAGAVQPVKLVSWTDESFQTWDEAIYEYEMLVEASEAGQRFQREGNAN